MAELDPSRKTADLMDRVARGESISNLTREEWERLVVGYMTRAMAIIAQNSSFGGPAPESVIPSRQGREYEIMRDFFKIEQKLIVPSGTNIFGYEEQKTRYLKVIAGDIKRKNQYYVLTKVFDTVGDPAEPDFSGEVQFMRYVLKMDALALYLLVCEPKRFLVGVKNGVHWKRTFWPSMEWNRFLSIATTFLANLKHVGKKEADIYPERFVSPNDLQKVNIPKPARSKEDLIEEAFYNQRYILPPEGAEVRLRRGGDIQKVLVVQSGNYLIAKPVLPYGESLLFLDVANAAGFSLPTIMTSNIEEIESRNSPWLDILAEIYHDLLIAVEKKRQRRKTSVSKEKEDEELEIELGGRLGIVYIPRVVHIGQPLIKERPPYEGPPRPTTPHRVVGHKRKANMTEKHRQELIRFEQRHGIKILENLPVGYTFVRPFIVPVNANLAGLPVFIKRRIETRLAEELQK